MNSTLQPTASEIALFKKLVPAQIHNYPPEVIFLTLYGTESPTAGDRGGHLKEISPSVKGLRQAI